MYSSTIHVTCFADLRGPACRLSLSDSLGARSSGMLIACQAVTERACSSGMP